MKLAQRMLMGQLRHRPPWYLNNTDLARSIIAYWPLDETSGQRNDRVGSNHLTDNATVTSAAGITYPLAAEFVIANSEFLSCLDNATLSGGNVDMWGAIRVRPAAVNVASTLFGKFHTTGNREWQISQSNDDVILTVSPDGTSNGLGTITIADCLTAGEWTHIMWYHDSVNDLIGLSIDGAAFQTTAHSTGIFDGVAAFIIGRQGSATAYFGGRAQEAVLGKGYVPTVQDASFFLTMAQ